MKTTHPNPFQIEAAFSTPLPFTAASLERFVRKILLALKLKKVHVSLLFVKDPAMKRWHYKLMKLRSTTDVISISQKEEKGSYRSPNPLGSLGDLIICVDEAKRQAKRAGCTVQEELGRYVVHGILHCLGYDDVKPGDRKEMWALQEKLVKRYASELLK